MVYLVLEFFRVHRTSQYTINAEIAVSTPGSQRLHYADIYRS